MSDKIQITREQYTSMKDAGLKVDMECTYWLLLGDGVNSKAPEPKEKKNPKKPRIIKRGPASTVVPGPNFKLGAQLYGKQGKVWSATQTIFNDYPDGIISRRLGELVEEATGILKGDASSCISVMMRTNVYSVK